MTRHPDIAALPRSIARGAMAALLAMVPLSGWSTQILDAADGATLYAKVSKREITRITLDHGRIATLRVREGQLVIDADEDTGQVYVTLATDADKPINAFITTDAGQTVTLLLQPVDVPADSIVLRVPQPRGPGEPARAAGDHVQAQRALLVALASDQIPPRADVRELADPQALWEGFAVTLVRTITTERLVGERYLLTNQTGATATLEEREFYRPGVNAIAIDRLTLASGDSTAVYVVRERNGDD